MIRADAANDFEYWLQLVELFRPEAEERRQEADSCKHRLADDAVCHVSSDQTAERASEQEKWRFLLVNFVLFDSLEDEQPLIIVDVVSFLDNNSRALAFAKASLIDGKHFKIKISEVLCYCPVCISVRPIPMQVEHNSLAMVLWRVPVGFEFDFLAKLQDW